jgi:hypothetical protein
VKKIPEEVNLWEERYILAQSFRGFSPWSLGLVGLGSTVGEHIIEETSNRVNGCPQGG